MVVPPLDHNLSVEETGIMVSKFHSSLLRFLEPEKLLMMKKMIVFFS
jgi:hypothetical protein